MTGEEFKKAIARLDMTQGATADFLSITIKSVNTYANDRAPIPEGTAKLLRLMVRLNLKPEKVK